MRVAVFLLMILAVMGIGAWFAMVLDREADPVPSPPVTDVPTRTTPSTSPILLLDVGSVSAIESQRDAASPDEVVAALLRLGGPEAYAALVRAYIAWADRPDAQEARRTILAAFLDAKEPALALGSFVSAVSRDGVQPEDDPQWEYAITALPRLWPDPATFSAGRDLFLVSVKSPKAQRLLAGSFMEYGRQSEIPDGLRLKITDDLGDVYSTTNDPKLKAEIRAGIGNVGGPEVARAVESVNAGREDPREIEAMRQAMRELNGEQRSDLESAAAKLVDSACSADTSLEQFRETVTAIKVLGSRSALEEVSRRARILARNAEAQAIIKAALDSLDD